MASVTSSKASDAEGSEPGLIGMAQRTVAQAAQVDPEAAQARLPPTAERGRPTAGRGPCDVRWRRSGTGSKRPGSGVAGLAKNPEEPLRRDEGGCLGDRRPRRGVGDDGRAGRGGRSIGWVCGRRAICDPGRDPGDGGQGEGLLRRSVVHQVGLAGGFGPLDMGQGQPVRQPPCGAVGPGQDENPASEGARGAGQVE